MINQLGEIIRLIVVISAGFTYDLIYQNLLGFFGILFGLLCWAASSFIFGKWKQFGIWTLIGVSLIVGAWRIAEFPVTIHDDESIKYSKHSARHTKPSPKVYLTDGQSWFDNYKPFSVASMEDIKDPPYLRCFWNKRIRHKARPRVNIPVVCQMHYIATKIFGNDYRAYRMSSVMIGAVCVLIFFLFLRNMFGYYIALAGGYMMALAPWHLALSRIHLPYIATNMYVVMCLYIFWIALKRPALFLILGVMIGFSVPMYSSIKVVYYIIPIYMIYALIWNKWPRKNIIIGFILLVVIAYPLFSIQGGLPSVYGYPQCVGYNFTWEAPINTLTAVYSFSWHKFTTFSKRNYIELGLRFSPWVTGLALLGMLVCVNKIKDKRSIFLLLWMGTALAPDACTLIQHTSRRTTQVIAPMIALSVYGLIFLRGKLKKVIVIILIALSFYGMYIGYFKMYENLILNNKGYAARYEAKMTFINKEN